MSPEEYQQWLGAHGQPLVVDGRLGPKTREATLAAFTNACAPAATADDLATISQRLGCTVKQIKAVAQVESGGAAFDRNGRPKMLFERHYFHRMTNGAYSIAPFSNPKGGGYDQPSWGKLTFALCQDVDAAFASASWGKFQVMGSHAEALGYGSALELAYATVTGEAAHYDMLARYIEHFGLNDEVRVLSANPEDNRAFARAYNGPGYRNFNYHEKLAEAMR